MKIHVIAKAEMDVLLAQSDVLDSVRSVEMHLFAFQSSLLQIAFLGKDPKLKCLTCDGLSCPDLHLQLISFIQCACPV